MKRNPPAAADAPALERFASASASSSGKGFDPQDRRQTAGQAALPKVSYERIMAHFLTRDGDMTRENGWSFTTKAGTYGTNYIQRALVTAIGLGANRPQDAVYPTSLKPTLHRELQRRAQVRAALPEGPACRRCAASGR